MATTDWRGRWEERLNSGAGYQATVIDVIRNSKGKEYAVYERHDGVIDTLDASIHLIPKPQPPHHKQHRPYTEAELWAQIQRNSGVLWVKEKDKERWISVDRTENAGFLFKHYTHLDGSPFGMEVEGE